VLAVLGLLAVLCLSACQTTIQVGVDVNRNGSGSVTVTAHLDHDASAFAPNVRTSDLVNSGWTVKGPTPAVDGGVDFVASKGFANPTQARTVISELSGPSGPFRDLVISSHRSFFETTTTFGGTIDLTCGLNCFSDPQLQQALGGSADLGIDPSKLQADAGVIVDRLVQFEVAARLPGKVQTSNAPTQVGNGALWKARLGQKASLLASAREWNAPHIALVVVAGLCLVAAAALVVVKRGRRRHRPAHKKS
jgi:hypothetical protein